MRWLSLWSSLWDVLRGEYAGRILGILFGLFCGFLYLFCGFWDMLIFALIVYVGYYIGRRFDERRRPVDFRPIRSWLTERWRGFK